MEEICKVDVLLVPCDLPGGREYSGKQLDDDVGPGAEGYGSCVERFADTEAGSQDTAGTDVDYWRTISDSFGEWRADEWFETAVGVGVGPRLRRG